MRKSGLVNTIKQETYDRWFSELSKQKHALGARIRGLTHSEDNVLAKFQRELSNLSNLKQVYSDASTINKQSLVRLVFDNRLYFKNGTYRTPYVINWFGCNLLINSDNDYEFDQIKRGNFSIPPLGGAEGVTVAQLLPVLTYFESLKINI